MAPTRMQGPINDRRTAETLVLHTGQIYRSNDVSIGPPDADAVRKAFKAPDVVEWLSDALARADVYYFSIFWNQALVGQILLHDIHIYSSTYWRQPHAGPNPVPGVDYPTPTGESLVAYHVFDSQHRGRGFGAKALALLQQYTATCTDLGRLCIITSRGNPASQHIAQTCDFRLTAEGNAKENPNPDDLLEFVWEVPARTA